LLTLKTTLVLVKVAVTVSPVLVVPVKVPFRLATATILPSWTLNWVMATLRGPLTVTVSPVARVSRWSPGGDARSGVRIGLGCPLTS